MYRLKYFIAACIVAVSQLAVVATADAVSPSLVISQVMAGQSTGNGDANHEFVVLYNNTAAPVDITNWYITNKNNEFARFTAGDSSTHLMVPAWGSATVVSQAYAAAHPGVYDVTFVGANRLIASSDTVTVFTGTGSAIDIVAWGDLAAGSSLQRQEATAGVLKDTDAVDDFMVNLTPVVPASATYEEVADVCPNLDGVQASVPTGYEQQNGNCVEQQIVDVCPNIAGIQATMPTGSLANDQGDCYQDMCTNIDGLQVVTPNGYSRDESLGTCAQYDECPNITGIQATIPGGYKKDAGNCVLDVAALKITEVLPNVSGADAGREFIELYNPTDKTANLSLYKLYIGLNKEKTYQFPAGSTIEPGAYAVFYDSNINFSLVNTASKVSIAANDETVIDQTESYANPADNAAWALIDGAWRYTKEPTPGLANILVADELTVGGSGAAEDCPAGKYRNPLTNRCRAIEADAAVLAVCDSGQYRNPETGRCRKVITADVAQPCKEGQYRSEETNRCRNITTAAAELAACKEGQERNPETNRCRNITAKAVPDAAFAVQPIADSAKAFAGWWALGGVGALAVGYAGWEWRRELGAFMRRILPFNKTK